VPRWYPVGARGATGNPFEIADKGWNSSGPARALDGPAGWAPVRSGVSASPGVRVTVGSGRGEPRGSPWTPVLPTRDPRQSCTEIPRAGTSTPKHGSRETPAAPPSRTRPHLRRRNSSTSRSSTSRSERRRPRTRLRPASSAVKMKAPHSTMRARPGGRGGRTPWTQASGGAVSLADVFGARVPGITGCRHRGPGSAPAPPARPSPGDTDECAGVPVPPGRVAPGWPGVVSRGARARPTGRWRRPGRRTSRWRRRAGWSPPREPRR
jgi:hypothetical protein